MAGNDRLVAYEGPPLKNHREMLLYYGSTLHRLQAKGALTQFEPPPRLEDQQSVHDIYPDLFSKMEMDPSFAALIGWSVEWARNGFPRLELGHKLCASLMATSMTPEIIAEVVVPWPAFT